MLTSEFRYIANYINNRLHYYAIMTILLLIIKCWSNSLGQMRGE